MNFDFASLSIRVVGNWVAVQISVHIEDKVIAYDAVCVLLDVLKGFVAGVFHLWEIPRLNRLGTKYTLYDRVGVSSSRTLRIEADSRMNILCFHDQPVRNWV